jgi:type 1 glutamine amidotransferase
MYTTLARRTAGALLAGALVMASGLVATVPAAAADPAYKVLVFSKTAGFRHDSIAVGTQAIRDLGAANNFTVTATEDANAFTTANLAQYAAVIFLNTTGDVLNATQQTAFEGYINGGKGYVGVHSAADTEYDWPFYGTLMGAWFLSHPAIQQVTVNVEDRTHPSTAHLGTTWVRTDELYNYRTNPRPNVKVLLSLNESTYTGGSMGDHPFAWCHSQGSGRSFYTGGGHTQASYSDTAFRAHLLGGIRYAAGVATANCSAGTRSPQTVEGEAYTSGSGVQVANHTPASGGKTVGYIENGDWAGYSSASTTGRTGFSARVSSAGSGGTIQVRSGSQTGPLLGSVAVPVTGNWDTFVTVSTTLNGTGTGALFLVFTGGGGFLFDVDTATLTG